ncbi:hypothetical protein M407DRAFT_206182 [Tulasnella calospora MUT 4182]|uniref:Uncharacterized protein n=1 Tax=Tulasnella calospora MUT 4182 TaxID=1051891 RepID=A0A0C3Q844_9AGAM|nr:hypothetical protein M407DRAFT_206182 [Tulasnella calospora MUT 4182]
MNMLQRRYSMRSTGQQHVPDLTLDISSLQPWRLPWREKAILPFATVKALRGLDEVEEMRMGCSRVQSGILAVIWDEHESSPAWG